MTAQKAASPEQHEDGRAEDPIDPGGLTTTRTAGDRRASDNCSSGESNTRKRSASGLPARYKDSAEEGTDLQRPGSGQGSGQEDSKPTTGGSAPKSGKPGKVKPARPEGDAPCPRCQSDNTKFCYYNNGNIKQPRYFCKACARYWTAGGILRNIPPGAGKRKSKASAARESEKAAAAAAAKQAQQQAQQMAQQTAMQPPLRFTVLGCNNDLMANGAAGALGAGDQMRFMMDPMAAMGGGAWGAFPGASLPAGGMPNAGLGLVPGGMGGFNMGMGLDMSAMGSMNSPGMSSPVFGAFPSADASGLNSVSGKDGDATAAPSSLTGDASGVKPDDDGTGEDGRRVRARLQGDGANGAASAGAGPDQAMMAAQMAAAQAQLQQAAAMQAQAHMQAAAAAQWGQPQSAYGMAGGMGGASMWPFPMGSGYGMGALGGMGALPPPAWPNIGQMPRFSGAPNASYGGSNTGPLKTASGTVVQTGDGRAPSGSGPHPSALPVGTPAVNNPLAVNSLGGVPSGSMGVVTPRGAALGGNPIAAAASPLQNAGACGGVVFDIGANGVVGGGNSSGNLAALPGWGQQHAGGTPQATGMVPLQGMGWQGAGAWPAAEATQAPHMAGKPFPAGGAARVVVPGGAGSLLSGGSNNSGATGFLGAQQPLGGM